MESVKSNIEQYYDKVKDEYNLSLKEFELICSSPFKFVKEVLNRGILKDIRFQYFGVFTVSPSRVKYSKKQLQENFDNGLISEKRYKDRLEVLEGYESKS